MTLETLQPGDMRDVKLDARALFYRTGLELLASEQYRIEIVGEQRWNDWGCPSCGPEGIEAQNFWMHIGESLRMCPHANYMELLASIDGRREAVVPWRDIVENGCIYIPKARGEFTPCANDVPLLYFNNGGSLNIRLTYLKGA